MPPWRSSAAGARRIRSCRCPPRTADWGWTAPRDCGTFGAGSEAMNLTSEQQKTVLASFLGWMLDAFDFFILTFVLKDIAKEFGVDVPAVAYALFLTLAMR